MKRKENTKDLNQEGRVGTREPMDVSSREFQQLKAKIKTDYEALPERDKLKIEFESLRQKINTYLENDNNSPIRNFDFFVKEYLDVVGLKQKEFARFINYDPTNLNKILKGKRPLNYDLAFKIAESFELEPELLLMIQLKNHIKEHKPKKHYSSDQLLSFSKGNVNEMEHV